MLLMRLWNYLRGYVIIVVEGYFLEKFINMCTHRQIYLWDVKASGNCVMTLKASIKGFKRMPWQERQIGPGEMPCKCVIINRYRKRKPHGSIDIHQNGLYPYVVYGQLKSAGTRAFRPRSY